MDTFTRIANGENYWDFLEREMIFRCVKASGRNGENAFFIKKLTLIIPAQGGASIH